MRGNHFPRSLETGAPSGSDYAKYGYYTGCLLSIDADDATSITVSIDKGQLYRGEIETFVKSEEPKRWQDALVWKPSADHAGSAYEGYDSVQPLGNTDGKDKVDPSMECRVEVASLLGKTATFSPNEISKSFIGFWTNEPYEELDSNPLNASIATLDGARLAITIKHNDGANTQATYELKAVCVETSTANNSIMTTEREVSPDDTSVNSIYTLKAIPIAENIEQA